MPSRPPPRGCYKLRAQECRDDFENCEWTGKHCKLRRRGSPRRGPSRSPCSAAKRARWEAQGAACGWTRRARTASPKSPKRKTPSPARKAPSPRSPPKRQARKTRAVAETQEPEDRSNFSDEQTCVAWHLDFIEQHWSEYRVTLKKMILKATRIVNAFEKLDTVTEKQVANVWNLFWMDFGRHFVVFLIDAIFSKRDEGALDTRPPSCSMNVYDIVDVYQHPGMMLTVYFSIKKSTPSKFFREPMDGISEPANSVFRGDTWKMADTVIDLREAQKKAQNRVQAKFDKDVEFEGF